MAKEGDSTRKGGPSGPTLVPEFVKASKAGPEKHDERREVAELLERSEQIERDRRQFRGLAEAKLPGPERQRIERILENGTQSRENSCKRFAASYQADVNAAMWQKPEPTLTPDGSSPPTFALTREQAERNVKMRNIAALLVIEQDTNNLMEGLLRECGLGDEIDTARESWGQLEAQKRTLDLSAEWGRTAGNIGND